MKERETAETGTAPLRKTLELKASAARAFRHFTDNIHVWWPLATHSLALAAAKSVVFEARAGGRIYEIEASGREREWGRVLVCDPPRRLVFSWVLEAPEDATEVEARFEETGAQSCRLVLEHRGWDARRDGALWRGRYDYGWDGVIGQYASTL